MSKLLRIFIIVSMISFANGDDTGSGDPEAKNPVDTRALEKSLIFPGWGQIHEKKYFKGVVFITAELIAITSAVISNRLGNKNYNKYRSAVTESDALHFRKETERFDRERNLYIAAGIGIWIINMVDIYFFKKKMEKKGLNMSLKKGMNNEIYFTLNYSF